MAEKKVDHSCTLDKIISLCKRRGFVYQASEIYGGQAGAWDYGPLGVEFKRNIQNEWWHYMTQLHDDVVGLDSAIFQHHTTWKASGHADHFSDPMIDCLECQARHRADKMIEDYVASNPDKDPGKPVDTMSHEEMESFIKANINCPVCGSKERKYTAVREFNLMFKTYQGPIADEAHLIYLRPETCQGIFTDFKSIVQSNRMKIPFGVAQVGKSFRNEIIFKNFIFRTAEFEQMEMEYFCKPGQKMKLLNAGEKTAGHSILNTAFRRSSLSGIITISLLTMQRKLTILPITFRLDLKKLKAFIQELILTFLSIRNSQRRICLTLIRKTETRNIFLT